MTTLISNIAIGKSISIETLNQISQAALTGLRDGMKCTSGHFLMYKVAGCDRWLNIQPGARIDDTFLMNDRVQQITAGFVGEDNPRRSIVVREGKLYCTH